MAHFPSCPLSIFDILTTSTISSPLLVVLSPLLLHHHLLSISWRAASASQCARASCPLLLPVASSFPAGCHVASHRAATSCHLLLRRRLKCPSSTPPLHLHWLVVSHLVALPLPSVLFVNTAASQRAATSQLPFTSRSPWLVAALPHVAPLHYIH